MRVISSLREIRGGQWQWLVDRVTAPDAEETAQVAFSLMMVRLAGCAGCNVDSFRAMRGCSHCAQLTIKRYKGSDEDLLQLFSVAHDDVNEYLSKYE